MKPTFSASSQKQHHGRMLIVKVRPTVVPHRAAFLRGRTAEIANETPGLSSLDALERSGLVRRVVPLARRTRGAPELRSPFRSALAIISSVDEVPQTDPAAGVSIVEFETEDGTETAHSMLARDPNIEAVSRVPIRYLVAKRGARVTRRSEAKELAATSPPVSLWNLRKIRWHEARGASRFREATDIRVAVLDTGIDLEHPDLRTRVRSYTFEHPTLDEASSNKDIVGHGTHVAGTIAAGINNDFGVNGVCECELHAWKIFDDQADYDEYANRYVYFVDPVMYRRALADCLTQQMHVVNLSIGGPGKPDIHERRLFEELLGKGTTIVAAMGNERDIGSPISYPAAIPGVIAVGATSINDTVAEFSNRGGHISMCAPGVGIWSTLPTYPGQFGFSAVVGPNAGPTEGKADRRGVHYDAWNGTSMATPHVAAAAALYLARNGKADGSTVKEAVETSSDPVPAMNGRGFHPDYGRGRLNLERLLS